MFKSIVNTVFRCGLGFVLVFMLSSCAYHWGTGNRAVPGGYKSISIPVFKNKSYETGIEVAFTNALLQEFQRSKVARITPNSLSEVRIEGEILEVKYYPSAKKVSGDETMPYLPEGTVLATEYDINLKANLRVVRQSDNIEIWSGSFTGSRSYTAPQVTIAGLNSVNPLYNQSARRQYIEALAGDLMAEAHNKMTESF